jgi:hypothetical protein
VALLESSRSRIVIAAGATLAACIALALAGFRHGSSILAAESNRAATSAVQQPNANPVIVELFTSEGCSSCPPADALLAHLQQDQPVASANIITLEEHVDYWDHLGWRDRFSSPTITQRQQNYSTIFHLDDVFTPQMVVNGSAQFNGTDSTAIRNAIAHASATTVPLQLTSVKVGAGNTITFQLANAPATHPEYVRIYAALVDPQDTTAVHAGENTGRTLRHVDAVRVLAQLGDAWHMNTLGERSFSMQFRDAASAAGMRLVVFAQTKPLGPILGATTYTITPDDIEPRPIHSLPDGPQPPSPTPH